MIDRIQNALTSRTPARLWLALVALSQLAGIPARPHQEGPHVYLADLRLTRGGEGWIVARQLKSGSYRRTQTTPIDAISQTLEVTL